MSRLQICGALLLTTLLGVPGVCRGQSPPLLGQSPALLPETPVTDVPSGTSPTDAASLGLAGTEVHAELPDAPGEQIGGVITGTVLDPNGAEIKGALVKVQGLESKKEHASTTDAAGSFRFDAIEPGRFKVTITAAGFASWVSAEMVLGPNEGLVVPVVQLRIASATTDVEVTLTQHDIAEEQIKAQERQRVLGVVPNFWVSYVWDAAPLTAGQKFKLALRSAVDPVSFVGAAFGAGLEMWQKDYVGYGNGAQGFFTRMGASYGDGFNSSMIAGAILPSVLHQDPRYFYKGKGSIRSRALYALSTIAVCKGDNGKWQPNYSNIFGNLASAGLSNSYYPPANRGVKLTFDNWAIGTASGAVGNLIQEFLIKKISRGVPKQTGP